MTKKDMSMQTLWKVAFWVGVVFGLCLAIGFAHAHDHDHPELDSWFLSLHNKHKVPCCDLSDGHAIAPEDWKSDHGHYKALVNDVWMDVPDEAVLDDQPNKAGRALIWTRRVYDGSTQIECFMPGPMT